MLEVVDSSDKRLQAFKNSSLSKKKRLRTTTARSEAMGKVRKAGTGPELAVRRVLSDLGVRFTIQNQDLPGSPDLANRRRRFVVFVHGCFWHRHAGCRKTTTPTRNRVFWVQKFEANIRRDQRSVRALRRMGYRVLIVWECDTRKGSRLASRFATLLS